MRASSSSPQSPPLPTANTHIRGWWCMEDKGAHSCLTAMTFLSVPPNRQPPPPLSPTLAALSVFAETRLSLAAAMSPHQRWVRLVIPCRQLTSLSCMCVCVCVCRQATRWRWTSRRRRSWWSTDVTSWQRSTTTSNLYVPPWHSLLLLLLLSFYLWRIHSASLNSSMHVNLPLSNCPHVYGRILKLLWHFDPNVFWVCTFRGDFAYQDETKAHLSLVCLVTGLAEVTQNPECQCSEVNVAVAILPSLVTKMERLKTLWELKFKSNKVTKIIWMFIHISPLVLEEIRALAQSYC